ncbi:MAG: hypothetical protein IPP43_03540 [Chitinophagaceae bacterium]|nr:hypothetical protein [Chitinophagaceae bacterium]
MCGIAGFISPNFNQEHLQRITSGLKHRGPDAEGYFYDEANQVGLGHRRLSIIDLSAAANQPFYSHNGRYIMIYNGEMYNFKSSPLNIIFNPVLPPIQNHPGSICQSGNSLSQ